MLRKELHKEVERRVVCKINKEMTDRPIADIEDLLVGEGGAAGLRATSPSAAAEAICLDQRFRRRGEPGRSEPCSQALGFSRSNTGRALERRRLGHRLGGVSQSVRALRLSSSSALRPAARRLTASQPACLVRAGGHSRCRTSRQRVPQRCLRKSRAARQRQARTSITSIDPLDLSALARRQHSAIVAPSCRSSRIVDKADGPVTLAA